ncbi:hypothetical protein QBZ16_004958 [Prototheca wickerhamii]|uniref:N-acetyltransferase domain-containing protein n=1 Tax=Prototheca wickerhamii TaxID=3111 RepID=A0AAD9MGP6_PROWI|nr:hypothetical protein QBZ16_004958 [Prototheca wickerhamii]
MRSLGVKLVLVLGSPGFPEGGPSPEAPYPVTDCETMQTLIQAAGISKLQVEAFLSKAPLVALARRHTGKMGEPSASHAPMLTVVSGNYVAAKRRGVVGGVDLGASGAVRHVAGEAIAAQLAAGSVVLMTGLGFSAGGEALSCSPTAVATATAIALRADKLLLLTPKGASGPRSRALSGWLPLGEAEAALFTALGDEARRERLARELRGESPDAQAAPPPAETWAGGDLAGGGGRPPQRDLGIDLEKWAAEGPALPLLAACAACRAGVKRAHLVDAARDGGLLLELYSRDGVGSMISTDLYEGIRPAVPADLPRIAELLRPLEERGFLVRRTPARLSAELPDFIVWERDGRVLGCVAAHPLGEGVAELAAFAVHPAYRGLGKGDSLLEFLEARVASQGVRMLVLLTTRTADWFRQRGFAHAGRAAGNLLLPEARRGAIDPARNSQLYAKRLA